MRSEALDMLIENRSGTIWIKLSGPFNQEQVPNMREKFHALIDDGNRFFIIDLENIVLIDDSVMQLFLQLLNSIKTKGGELKFIFKNEIVSKVFSPYFHLFQIYPDAASYPSGGFLDSIRRTHKLLTRRTGIRISRPVAIFLIIVLCGWFLSLLFIVHLQNSRINEQQAELHDLHQWKQHALIEMSNLKDRIRPFEQLGILKDTTKR
jgi:anti-anti-sigma factor